jgi:hypothetical protein
MAPSNEAQELEAASKVDNGGSGRPSVNKESRDLVSLALEDTKRSSQNTRANDQIQENDLTTPKVGEEAALSSSETAGDGGAGNGDATIEVASINNDSRPAALLPTATKVAAAPGVCPKTEPLMKRPVSAFGTTVTGSSTSSCSESSVIGPTSTYTTGETRLENKRLLHYVEGDFLDQCRGESGGVVGCEEVEVMYAIVKVDRDTTAQESDKHYDYYDL